MHVIQWQNQEIKFTNTIVELPHVVIVTMFKNLLGVWLHKLATSTDQLNISIHSIEVPMPSFFWNIAHGGQGM